MHFLRLSQVHRLRRGPWSRPRDLCGAARAQHAHATVGEVIIVRIAKVRRGPPADGPLAWPPERMPDTARKTAPAWLSTDAGADDDADDEDYVLPGAHAAPGGARSTRGRRRGHRPFRPADCDAVRQGDQPAMQGGRGGSTQRATLGKVMVAARAASPCPRSAPSTSYSASCATIPIGLRRLVAEPRADAQPLNAAAALHPRWPPDW